MSLWECSACKQCFEPDPIWTEEDAFSEALERLGPAAFTEDMVQVCDGCYEKYMRRAQEAGLIR